MKITKETIGLGGGEGSKTFYQIKIANCYAHIATRSAIKFNEPKTTWVRGLEFMPDFIGFHELKEIVEDCENPRFAEFVGKELVNLATQGKALTTVDGEQLEIMIHTRDRAAGQRYCGGSQAMVGLVKSDIMVSVGFMAHVQDEYFKLTDQGQDFIKNIKKG